MGNGVGIEQERIGYVIGRNAKRIRKHSFLRQSDVAAAGRIPSQRLSDLERGAMPNPSSEIVEAVALGLGVSMDELMRRPEA